MMAFGGGMWVDEIINPPPIESSPCLEHKWLKTPLSEVADPQIPSGLIRFYTWSPIFW